MPRGPKPKADAQRPDQRRHQIKHAPDGGWRFGDPKDKRRRRPKAPATLRLAETAEVWDVWFSSWWAAFWDLEDLPGLELVITMYEGVMLGMVDSSKLVPLLDRYGITPKGRQDLRWAAPEAEPESTMDEAGDELAEKRKGRKLA